MATIASLVVDLHANVARFQSDMDRAAKRVEASSRRMEKSIGGVERTLNLAKKAVVGYLAALSVREVVGFSRSIAETSDELKLMRERIQLLSGSATAFDRLLDSANRLGVGLNDAVEPFGRFAIAGEAIGMATHETIKLTETVLKLGRIGGSAGSELASGALQLGQALASGRLQGDELRSIMENMPLLARALAQELGVGVGQLKEMGKNGELTAEVVAKALLAAADGVDQQFKKLSITLKQEEARLSNAFGGLMEAIDKRLEVSETYKFFTANLARGIRAATADLNGVDGRSMEDLAAQTEVVNAKIADLNGQIARLEGSKYIPQSSVHKIAVFRQQVEKLKNELVEIESRRSFLESKAGNIARQDEAQRPKPRPAAPASNELSKGDKKLIDDLAKRQIDEAVREYEAFNRVQEEGRRVFEQTRTPAEEYNAEIDRLKELLAASAINQNTFSRAADAATERLIDQQNAAEKAAESLRGHFIDGWGLAADAIEGFARRGEISLKSFAAVAAEVFAQYLRQRKGSNGQISFGSTGGGDSSFGSFFSDIGGLFGYADGGRPPVGVPSVVGERGPELFVPDRAGTIIPNHELGGGGRTIIVDQTINFNGGSGADIRAAAPQIVAASKAAVLDAIRRGERGFNT